MKNDLTIKFIISKDDVKVDNLREWFKIKVEHFSADGKYEVRLMTKAELKYTGYINKAKCFQFEGKKWKVNRQSYQYTDKQIIEEWEENYKTCNVLDVQAK